MKKISPANVKAAFLEQLADITNFHYRVGLGLTTEADQSTLTEHSLLATAVAWEGFVSDMFIAYINGDSSRFIAHLKNAFFEHLKLEGKPMLIFQRFGTLAFPEHLNKADVQQLANSIGNNITFSNYPDLEERAETWLSVDHANKFSNQSVQSKAVVNALISLRNHIAHRSERSLKAMNEVLAAGALYQTGIKRAENKFHNVGAWLKAKPPGRPDSRLTLIVQTLSGIGQSF